MALGDIRKDKFIVDIILFVKAVAPWSDISDELYSEYFNNGYNGGGADVLTDADVLNFDIPVATVTSYITFLENFNKYKNGTASVAASQYIATINKMRYAVNDTTVTNQKDNYVSRLCQMVEGLQEWIDIGPHIRRCYDDNGYDTGIVQLDLDKYELLLGEFTNGITMLTGWNNLFDGSAVAVVDHRITINNFRAVVI